MCESVLDVAVFGVPIKEFPTPSSLGHQGWMTSHYLLSSRRPAVVERTPFSFLTHQFVSALERESGYNQAETDSAHI